MVLLETLRRLMDEQAARAGADGFSPGGAGASSEEGDDSLLVGGVCVALQSGRGWGMHLSWALLGPLRGAGATSSAGGSVAKGLPPISRPRSPCPVLPQVDSHEAFALQKKLLAEAARCFVQAPALPRPSPLTPPLAPPLHAASSTSSPPAPLAAANGGVQRALSSKAPRLPDGSLPHLAALPGELWWERGAAQHMLRGCFLCERACSGQQMEGQALGFLAS